MTSLSLCVLLAIFGLCGASTQPGMKIRFSRPGLDFVSNAALDLVTASLTDASVGDQHERIGKSIYDMSNVWITSFTKPTATTTMARDSGITWNLSGGAISVKGNWHYQYKGGWLLSANDRGTFDVSVSEFDINISIIIGVDQTGQPTIHTTGCTSHVRSVNIHLHGDQEWLYNMFDDQVASFVKTQLTNKLCEVAKSAVDDNGAKRMKQLSLQVDVTKWLVVDDRLVQAPRLMTDYVESLHKGEVFEYGKYTEAPFQPKLLPDEPMGGTRMMTVWISEYVLNTLGYVLQRKELMHYNVSNKELAKKGQPHLLDISCPGDVCIGSVIPGLSKQFPNGSVAINLVSFGEENQPRFTILPGQIQGHLAGMAYFSVKTANSREIPLLKAQVDLVVIMDAHISDKRVKTKMSNLSIKMKFIHSTFGKATEQKLEAFFMKIADTCIKPKLDEIGDVGLVIPQFKDVEFVHPVVKIIQGAVQLGVDFKFTDTVVLREP